MDKAPIDRSFSDLMRRSQSGDAAAYQLLLTGLSGVLDRFLSRRIERKETREDLCQEILMSVHHSRHTYDPSRPFLPWVHAIAHFKVIDYWRKSGRHPEHMAIEEALFEAASTYIPREAMLSEAGITEHLHELPDKQRIAIELVKQEGLSIAEAAQKMGMSESAVKVSIHRAIVALRKKLGAKGGGDEN